MITYAIVVAAGQGTRYGGTIPKSMIDLGGKPLVVHCLEVLNRSRYIDKIILVTLQELIVRFEKEIIPKYSLNRIDEVVEGGKLRQDSVMAGLKAIAKSPDFVLIQDGARPFLTDEMISKTLTAAKSDDAAVIGTKITDTIKESDSDRTVLKTVPRDNLWAVQTPQTFNYSILIGAYQWAFDNHLNVTDDASLVEQFGKPVKIIPGPSNNIKVTTKEDLILAESILKNNDSIKN